MANSTTTKDTNINTRGKLETIYKQDRNLLAEGISQLAVQNGATNEAVKQIKAFVTGQSTNFGLGANWALAGLSNLIFKVLVAEMEQDLLPSNQDFFKIFNTEDIEVGSGYIKRKMANFSADVTDLPNFNSTSATVQSLIVGNNVKNQIMYESAAVPFVNPSGTIGKLFSITVPMEVGKIAFTSIQAFRQIVDIFSDALHQTKELWLKNWAWNFVFNTMGVTNTITDSNNNIYLDTPSPYVPSNLIDWTQNIFIPTLKRMGTLDNRFNVDGGLNTATNKWDFSAAILANQTCLTSTSATFCQINASKPEDLIAFVPVGIDGKYEFGVQSNKFNYKFSELLSDIPKLQIVPLNKYINFSENNIQSVAMGIPSMGASIVPQDTIYLVDKKAFSFGKLWEMLEENLWSNTFIKTLRSTVAMEGMKISWENGVKFVSPSIAIIPTTTGVN